MIHSKIRASLAAVVLLMLMTAMAGRAQVYQVTVDTSPINGQAGFLDLQFNPGGMDALAARVTLDSVSTDGALASMATDTGGAIGMLPGPPAATIDNSAQFNDLFQGIIFGNQIRFDVTFTGAALSPPSPLPSSGSTFAVSLYDMAGTTPLLTTNGDGSMLHLDLNPDGSITAAAYPDNSGVDRATATPFASGVPEPGALYLLGGMGVTGATLLARRRS